jgi:hypothetical protein
MMIRRMRVDWRLPDDPWAFLDRDEDYVPDVEHPHVYFDYEGNLRTTYLEGSFCCVGCQQRRPNSCGGADETLISVVCDYCTVHTWDNLKRVCYAIGLHQQLHNPDLVRPTSP